MHEILRVLSQPAILPLIGYALGLYLITETLKILAARRGGKSDEIVRAYVSILPAVIGALTGPFVVPYLIAELGGGEAVPVTVSVFTGVTTGGLSKVLWDLLNKIIRRRLATTRGRRDDDSL